jgi:signal transduction histidine kinase
MPDFLAEIEQLVGPGLRKRSIAFDVAVPHQGLANFDRVLVEQAVVNLVKNAADAVDGVADPAIRLAALCGPDALVIEVGDNGPGIEDDLLEDIFVPFFTTKKDGAGIGLALARQIALAHGGGLTAHSTRSGGSTFRFSLPVQL